MNRERRGDGPRLSLELHAVSFLFLQAQPIKQPQHDHFVVDAINSPLQVLLRYFEADSNLCETRYKVGLNK
jgi:hypothetical protein